MAKEWNEKDLLTLTRLEKGQGYRVELPELSYRYTGAASPKSAIDTAFAAIRAENRYSLQDKTTLGWLKERNASLNDELYQLRMQVEKLANEKRAVLDKIKEVKAGKPKLASEELFEKEPFLRCLAQHLDPAIMPSSANKMSVRYREDVDEDGEPKIVLGYSYS